MHPFEIMDALDSIQIIADTREQQTDKAIKRYAQFGCPVIRKALPFGDYSAVFILPDGTEYSLADKVVIERKMDLTELCGCFCAGRARFEREFVRAKAAGAKVYLLVEDASWEKAYAGRYRSRMQPNALVASMLAWLARFNCQLIMCEAKKSGRLIRDILYREGKERLENSSEDDI